MKPQLMFLINYSGTEVICISVQQENLIVLLSQAGFS